MQYQRYLRSLTTAELEAYAARAGTSVGYIRNAIRNANKIPRPDLLNRLLSATEGEVSREEILEHFYPAPREAA